MSCFRYRCRADLDTDTTYHRLCQRTIINQRRNVSTAAHVVSSSSTTCQLRHQAATQSVHYVAVNRRCSRQRCRSISRVNRCPFNSSSTTLGFHRHSYSTQRHCSRWCTATMDSPTPRWATSIDQSTLPQFSRPPALTQSINYVGVPPPFVQHSLSAPQTATRCMLPWTSMAGIVDGAPPPLPLSRTGMPWRLMSPSVFTANRRRLEQLHAYRAESLIRW